MQKASILFPLCLALFSCTNSAKKSTVNLDFGSFILTAPDKWKKIKQTGVDSYVGKIALDDIDTLEFDLGWYSYDLSEYEAIKLADGKTYYIDLTDTSSKITFVDSVHKYQVVKSNISWDTIDGRKAKILSPVKPGTGTTGIYFDSLWGSDRNRIRFNLYGSNLKADNQLKVLTAFSTLKFKHPK